MSNAMGCVPIQVEYTVFILSELLCSPHFATSGDAATPFLLLFLVSWANATLVLLVNF